MLERGTTKPFLNIGPGRGWARDGWQTLDYYFTDADYVLDLRELVRMPLPSCTLEAVFSSHTIEHISDRACRRLFAECFRLLRPGGTLRISCPDFERAIRNYLEHGDPDPHNEVVTKTLKNAEQHLRLLSIFASFRCKESYKGVSNEKSGGYAGGPILSAKEVRRQLARKDALGFGRWCVKQIPESAEYVAHINCYNFEKLQKMLWRAGFRTIERSSYLGSKRADLREDGLDNRPYLSLFVEARATGLEKRIQTLLHTTEAGSWVREHGSGVYLPAQRFVRKLSQAAKGS